MSNPNLQFSFGQETSRGSLTTATVPFNEGTVYFAYNINNTNDGYSGPDARIYVDAVVNSQNKRLPINALYSNAAKQDVEGKNFLTNYMLINSSTPTLTNNYTLTFSSTDSTTPTIRTVDLIDKYISNLVWVDGSTNGPTAQIYTSTSGSSTKTLAFTTDAFPKASGTTSGVITTNAQTIAGVKTFTSGIKVSGRVQNSGDDEGIVIGRASNNYAGVCLGDPTGLRSVFYLTNNDEPTWRYVYINEEGTPVGTNILHPRKSGTIALTSDVATVNTALSNFSTAVSQTYFAIGTNNGNNSFTLTSPDSSNNGGPTKSFTWTAANDYPTTFEWTSQGDTLKGTMSFLNNGSSSSLSNVITTNFPIATDSGCGVMSTSDQTFKGIKNFLHPIQLDSKIQLSYNTSTASLDFSFL